MKATLTLLTALLLAPLSALILHAVDAPTPARNGPAQLFPSFQWYRVPVNIHFGKRGEMTDDKIVLANGIRAGQHLDFLDWEGIDGVMIEHFDAYHSKAPEDLKADLDSMALAAAKGKFVVLKGWPALTEAESQVKGRSRAEQLRLARERITFPLACFLIGAQPGCHFCYSWG